MQTARGNANTKYCMWTGEGRPPCEADRDVGAPYWAAVADAMGAYVKGLGAIRFPQVAGAEAIAEIDDSVIVVRRARAAADATSSSAFITLAAAAQAASETESQTRQLLKDALGLPVGP